MTDKIERCPHGIARRGDVCPDPLCDGPFPLARPSFETMEQSLARVTAERDAALSLLRERVEKSPREEVSAGFDRCSECKLPVLITRDGIGGPLEHTAACWHSRVRIHLGMPVSR